MTTEAEQNALNYYNSRKLVIPKEDDLHFFLKITCDVINETITKDATIVENSDKLIKLTLFLEALRKLVGHTEHQLIPDCIATGSVKSEVYKFVYYNN